jgi:ubiquinone/menaquinone biosynthesis C-methylase UbiE
MTSHFLEVTEIEGQRISVEQLDRTCHRYWWAASEISGLEAVEVACGSGLGLELLLQSAARLEAGDYSGEVLEGAIAAIGDRMSLSVFNAEAMPFADKSLDAVLLCEALYYLPDPEKFFAEAARVLRPGGKLLLVTCNKDLYDFNPSPYTYMYFGVAELSETLPRFGFRPNFAGYTDITKTSLRQRVLRPIKALAARANLIPKTMVGKRFFKRLFFGQLTTMPSSIASISFDYQPPVPIAPAVADRRHKVIYCHAILEEDLGSDTASGKTENP